ncbi:hypothetical protein Pelo_16481 [Pelomyxa schiedti]|nr:hypothetical protein Pelo_16481 [Pelomyxa schiedti]
MADGAGKGGVGKVCPSRNGESAAATGWRKRREHDDAELFVVDGTPEALEIPRTARRLLGVTLAELPPDDIFASFAGSREIREVGRLGESMRIYVILTHICPVCIPDTKPHHHKISKRKVFNPPVRQFQAFDEEASKLKSWCMQCKEIVIDGSTFISEFSVRKTQFNNLKIQCDKLVEKRNCGWWYSGIPEFPGAKQQ